MSELLEARVRAANRANEYANTLYPLLRDALTTCLGCKVLKADGSFRARVASLLPTLPRTSDLFVYRNPSNYSLAWTVKTSESAGDVCVYAEVSVYVAELDNGNVLTKFMDYTPLRTDYSADEVANRRQAYREAQKVADAAKAKLHPFGETDR